MRAGDAGDAMYLIESGEAAVSIGGGKQTILRTGDFFGEMALLERRRHKHDVVAKSRCRVLVLDTQALSRLTSAAPGDLGVYPPGREDARRKRPNRWRPGTAGANRAKSPSHSKQDEPETI